MPAAAPHARSTPADSGAAVDGLPAVPSVSDWLGAVRGGRLSAPQAAAAALARAERHGVPASAGFAGATPVAVSDPVDVAWIDRHDAVTINAAAERAATLGTSAALAGLPIAVKGSLDVAGLPTTLACPGFASGPAEQSATAVARLEAAGAIVLGTTNLDQFATGLNGTRSPYGAPHAVGHPGRISGGSSSGSAVAVARGDVALSVATDTAGSGRVPAALNGIVGFKPSRGLISTRGLFPACESFDCVTVMATDVDAVALALDVMIEPDAADPGARDAPLPPAFVAERAGSTGLRLAIPHELPDTVIEPEAAAAWTKALELAGSLDVPGGVELVPIDLEPLYRAGAMLYGSAIVAERTAVIGPYLAAVHAGQAEGLLDPTVDEIIRAGVDFTATQALTAVGELRALTRQVHALLSEFDALLTPTVLEHPTHAQLAADPVGANARLGTFTTFGNLLDLVVGSFPSLPRADGLPFGVSLHAPAFGDRRLLRIAARWERAVAAAQRAAEADPERLTIAVGGAHMAGMAANAELIACGGRYERLTRTDGTYRLHVLDTPLGPRPGIEHVGAVDGTSVEVELWSLPLEGMGAFTACIPPGLAVGPMTMLDGSTVLGFGAAAASTVASAPVATSWRAISRA